MKKFKRLLVLVPILFFTLFTGEATSMEVDVYKIHPRMVSYEYLTTCPKCGDNKMEGYYSLVDGYTQENCKSCWYLKVIEANSQINK